MLKAQAYVLLAGIALTMANTHQGSKERKSTSVSTGSKPPIQEVRGQKFRPETVRAANDLSDWDVLNEFSAVGDARVKRVRLYGFDALNAGTAIDITSTDAVVRRRIRYAVTCGMRPCVSDFGNSSGGVGGGAHLGVLQLDTGDRKIIVGVSQVGFFLGIWHGSSRQSFYFWALAKVIDDMLVQATGRHLTKRVFDNLSGLAVIEGHRKFYYSTELPR